MEPIAITQGGKSVRRYFLFARPIGANVSESEISSAGLDPRRRRILFRAHHRGMREMDILFGKFADANLPTFTEAELTEFESLMEELDRDVLMWLTGETPTPPVRQTPFFGRLQAFHTQSGPINV